MRGRRREREREGTGRRRAGDRERADALPAPCDLDPINRSHLADTHRLLLLPMGAAVFFMSAQKKADLLVRVRGNGRLPRVCGRWGFFVRCA